MLVLTRKTQQSIRIGDAIKVTILRVKGNTVRVGIQAPESVHIVRSELPDYATKGDTHGGTNDGTHEMTVIEEEIELPITPIVPQVEATIAGPSRKSGDSEARKVPLPMPQRATFSPDASVSRPR